MEQEGTTKFQWLVPKSSDKWLAILWLIAGLLIAVLFWAPNFRMADIELTGPKLLAIAFREDASVARIFDDGGFFMMIAGPFANVFVAIFTIVYALFALARHRIQGVIVLASIHFLSCLFGIIGGIVVAHSHSAQPFFSKLHVEPTFAYWLTSALQALVFVFSARFAFLRAKKNILKGPTIG